MLVWSFNAEDIFDETGLQMQMWEAEITGFSNYNNKSLKENAQLKIPANEVVSGFCEMALAFSHISYVHL